jgi:hypothetical protein
VRRTPRKLLARLDHARMAIDRMQSMFPDHEKWVKSVERAHDALTAFDAEVHAGRAERRSMVADVSSAWITWQRTYASAKHVVIGMLAGCDQLPLIREVFDDLADESPARLSQFPPPP